MRSGRRDGIFPVRTTSRAFARGMDSSGMVSLQDPAGRDMPDTRRPGRLFASPEEPDGRQSLVYALKDQSVRGNGYAFAAWEFGHAGLLHLADASEVSHDRWWWPPTRAGPATRDRNPTSRDGRPGPDVLRGLGVGRVFDELELLKKVTPA